MNATPVIVAYLSGQLQSAHEAIAAICKAHEEVEARDGIGWKSLVEPLILEAKRLLPEAEDGKNSSVAEKDFTQKEKNPKRKEHERNRNNGDLI